MLVFSLLALSRLTLLLLPLPKQQLPLLLPLLLLPPPKLQHQLLLLPLRLLPPLLLHLLPLPLPTQM